MRPLLNETDRPLPSARHVTNKESHSLVWQHLVSSREPNCPDSSAKQRVHFCFSCFRSPWNIWKVHNRHMDKLFYPVNESRKYHSSAIEKSFSMISWYLASLSRAADSRPQYKIILKALPSRLVYFFLFVLSNNPGAQTSQLNYIVIIKRTNIIFNIQFLL